MDWNALHLSFALAGWTTLLLVLLGLPLAWWIETTTWRGRWFIESIIGLPLVLPPTVLGYYLLILMSPESLPGGLWMKMTGRSLAFSFEGLLLASLLYSFPFAVQPFAASFASVNPRHLEAAWTLGFSRIRTFILVVLPLSISGVVGGAVLAFAHTLGEFGVVLMVGGNIPEVTRTLSISIYDDVQVLNYERAGKTSLFLLSLSFVLLLLSTALRRRGRAAWLK